jgi:hypothetical protein
MGFLGGWMDDGLLRRAIDKKFIKIVHPVHTTLPRLNMEFLVYFAHFCELVYVCIGVFPHFY